MLLEKKPYQDDFPIDIQIVRIKEYPIHYHQDIEFVYVLKGEIELKNGCCTYLLHEGDIFTNDGHEVHSIYETEQDNVVAVISISNLFFTQYFPELNKSCFLTHSIRENNPRLAAMRRMILNLLLMYLEKSFDYKQKCINTVLDLVEYLNTYFNLFAFEGRIITSFKSDNPVTVERISHLINYIYENHASKITLEELAEMEHLSTFYVSHLIHEYTGMSFRELLCFARTEWSEMDLLGTNKKISTIARDVGFSTTSYYEKYFLKWFERTPAEHRKHYASMIKSPTHRETVVQLPPDQIIQLIRRALSAENAQDNSRSHVKTMSLSIRVLSDATHVHELRHHLELSITPEDYRILGDGILQHLSRFSCPGPASLKGSALPGFSSAAANPDASNPRIYIQVGTHDSAGKIDALRNLLSEKGYMTSISRMASSHEIVRAGYDTIAALIYIFSQYVSQKEVARFSFSLRDQGEGNIIFKGRNGLLTSAGIPKPSFYAFHMLSRLEGSLIASGKYFAVIKTRCPEGTYAVLVYNHNDSLFQLCNRSATIHDANQILSGFKDELELTASLEIPPGNYLVSKYYFDHRNNLFALMSKMGFPDSFAVEDVSHLQNLTVPDIDAYGETVTDSLNLHFSIKGAGAQLVFIQPVK